MRAVSRDPLPARVSAYLASRTARLAVAGNTAAAAESAWPKARKTKSVGAAFDLLVAMNGGARRCMYCELDRGTDIDHFEPRARAPSRTFAWDNWLLACSECNSRKRNLFPPGLLDPTLPGYQPDPHLDLLPTTGAFALKTAEAVASEPVYGLNEHELQRARHRTFVLYQSVIRHFADAREANDAAQADRYRNAVVGGPHPSVLASIQRWHADARRAFLHAGCAAALDAWPEILAW